MGSGQQTEWGNLKLSPRKYVPPIKLPEGFEIDKVSIMQDAVRILETHYCTMDREQIISVVQNVLSSFVLEIRAKGELTYTDYLNRAEMLFAKYFVRSSISSLQHVFPWRWFSDSIGKEGRRSISLL